VAAVSKVTQFSPPVVIRNPHPGLVWLRDGDGLVDSDQPGLELVLEAVGVGVPGEVGHRLLEQRRVGTPEEDARRRWFHQGGELAVTEAVTAVMIEG
jgi:hypothetical protein